MLRITTTPPQRSVDDPALFILFTDPAWNTPMILDELTRLGPDDGDGPRHPRNIWLGGASGYSREAEITLPEILRRPDGPAVVKISHWLLPDAVPTMFELRALSALEWETATYLSDRRTVEICRRAIVRVHNIDDGSGTPQTIEPPRENGLITLAWMDALSLADRGAIPRIAEAAANLGRGVNGAGKP